LAEPTSADLPVPALLAVGGGRAVPKEAQVDDLLTRAAAGDEAAFATLYRDLNPRLLRYATSLVGSDADDVTSEAWLQIVRDLPAFAGDLDGFRGWSARIVRNRAMDLLRAGARRPAVPLPSDGPDPVAPDDTAGAALAQLGTARALQLIASLPAEQSEAVMLRAVVGLDARGAGEILGKSAGAVRVASHRGLRRLAKVLRSQGVESR
jgi:RNA polymerase sigma-70 factor (ECF subfamily)